jgi:excisionase family DNA binding protein
MLTDAKYLHVKEVARELRLHPATIYRMIHAGSLPSVRPGGEHGAIRIPAAELERQLFSSTPPAGAAAVGAARSPHRGHQEEEP